MGVTPFQFRVGKIKRKSRQTIPLINTERMQKQRGPSMEGPLFSFAASLGERIKLQPVRSRLAPQERCAQVSCASKPGGFMQPSGAQGAHKLLVRPGGAQRK